MAKIRSSSTNMGVMIKENASTYGTDPGTWTSGAYRVPFTSCDIKPDDEILPESGEYTALGAASIPTRGRRLARGSITVEPVYDGFWFWLLFGHGFGSEDVEVDTSIEEVADTTTAGLNTHGFDVGRVGDSDLAMRIYKNAWYETYTGLVCSRWVWEHTSGAIPTVTMDMVGVAAANPITADPGTDFSTATVPSDNRVKLTDLGRTDSDVAFGATQAALNITTVRIIGDRSIDGDDPEFLQNLITASKPGQQSNRAITIELEGTLEDTFDAAGSPLVEYLADTLSAGSIGYASSVDAVSGFPYQIRFDAPAISWTAFAGDMTSTGLIPWSATGLCTSGLVSGLTTPFESFKAATPAQAIPASLSTDLRCLMHVPTAVDADVAITGLGVSV